MDTRDVLASTGGRRRFARSARGLACALGVMFCLAPGAALAEARLSVAAEDETAAPMPFQLPAASASATAGNELGSTGMPSLSLLLVLLSGALVAGTLSSMFRSLSQRDAAHHPPAPSQRW